MDEIFFSLSVVWDFVLHDDVQDISMALTLPFLVSILFMVFQQSIVTGIEEGWMIIASGLDIPYIIAKPNNFQANVHHVHSATTHVVQTEVNWNGYNTVE
ncbi:hypothetical protein [Nitrospira sp. M1]